MIVGPDGSSRVVAGGAPAGVAGELGEVVGVAGHDEPERRGFAGGGLGGGDNGIVAHEAGEAGIGGEAGEDGFEVEMEIGNVAGEKAAGGEFALVKGEGFAGHEVDGNGVGAEGVED